MGYGGFGGQGGRGGRGGGDLRDRAQEALGPPQPAYEGLVDVFFVVSATLPWGFCFRSEQVNRTVAPTHQSRLVQAMKHIQSPVDNYTYMFGWDRAPASVWRCIKAYCTLGDYLETEGWAQASNAGHIASVTYVKDTIDGEVIDEDIAIELSAGFDFDQWMNSAEEPVSPSPTKRAKFASAGAATSSGAASSSKSTNRVQFAASPPERGPRQRR